MTKYVNVISGIHTFVNDHDYFYLSNNRFVYRHLRRLSVFPSVNMSYRVPEMQVTIKNRGSRTAYQAILDTEKNKEDAL